MKIYTCSNCGNPLYFENNQCLFCGRAVGFDPRSLSMIALEEGGKYRYCKNAEYGVCNWLVEVAPQGKVAKGTGAVGQGPASGVKAEAVGGQVGVAGTGNVNAAGGVSGASSAGGFVGQEFCIACALNRTIPALEVEDNRRRWKSMEVAKHRLVYTLLRLNLPFEAKGEKAKDGNEVKEPLVFDFMADGSRGERVMTGHDNGIITINIEEADEATRVRNKLDLGERYRTLLGHFRHEVGHFYWDVLVRNQPAIDRYRQLFGDERKDYATALQAYYSNGAPADWMQHFVSPYATSHSWEDWAETWAHYLHLMDTLETAWVFGIRINPADLDEEAGIKANIVQDPYGIKNFDRIIRGWLPLTFAVNSLNRSMGHPDFYPFVLSGEVIGKLKFIHELCQGRGAA